MFQGFQFPKTILMWVELHPGTAGWMQAIVAVYIAATIPVRAEAAPPHGSFLSWIEL